MLYAGVGRWIHWMKPVDTPVGTAESCVVLGGLGVDLGEAGGYRCIGLSGFGVDLSGAGRAENQ